MYSITIPWVYIIDRLLNDMYAYTRCVGVGTLFLSSKSMIAEYLFDIVA